MLKSLALASNWNRVVWGTYAAMLFGTIAGATFLPAPAQIWLAAPAYLLVVFLIPAFVAWICDETFWLPNKPTPGDG